MNTISRCSSKPDRLLNSLFFLQVNSVCSFDSSELPHCLALASENGLTIGTIDDIQKLHIQVRIPHQTVKHRTNCCSAWPEQLSTWSTKKFGGAWFCVSSIHVDNTAVLSFSEGVFFVTFPDLRATNHLRKAVRTVFVCCSVAPLSTENQPWRSTAAYHPPRFGPDVWYHHHQLPCGGEQVRTHATNVLSRTHLLPSSRIIPSVVLDEENSLLCSRPVVDVHKLPHCTVMPTSCCSIIIFDVPRFPPFCLALATRRKSTTS